MIDIERYIPEDTTEIITGGTRGINKRVERWADKNRIPKLIIKPDYKQNGSAAVILVSETIVECADYVVCIWDGESEGTAHAISYAKQLGKPLHAVRVHPNGAEEEVEEID